MDRFQATPVALLYDTCCPDKHSNSGEIYPAAAVKQHSERTVGYHKKLPGHHLRLFYLPRKEQSERNERRHCDVANQDLSDIFTTSFPSPYLAHWQHQGAGRKYQPTSPDHDGDGVSQHRHFQPKTKSHTLLQV